MSTEALQNSSNAFPSSFSGQHTQANTDPGKKNVPLSKTLLQRVQESDSRNWLYYQLFLRQDFDACDIAIAASEENTPAVQNTYAVYMKGLIAKRQGKLVEALRFMKQCYTTDNRNLEVLKELISLSYLTRAYQEALAFVELAKELQPETDWFTMHHRGLCHERLGDFELAEEYLKSAITIQTQEKAYIALAEFYVRHESYDKAGDVLDRAKRVFPDSLTLAARLGRLQIKGRQDLNRGFGNLAQAVSGTKISDEAVLLAVGSVMQQKADFDGALKKYEVILQDVSAASPAVLNNIGLCYLSKPRKSSAPKRDTAKAAGDDGYSQRIMYAVGCLKKAQQLAPLDWRISCNLGYLMRELQLYATASYYLMASIRLAQKNPSTEAYLMLAGVADSLDITSQANQVYKYSAKNNTTNDPVVYLNYATFLLRENEKARATEMAVKCRDAVAEWEQTGRPVEPSITEMLRLLKTRIPIPALSAAAQLYASPVTDSPAILPSNVEAPTSHGHDHELVVSAQMEQNN